MAPLITGTAFIGIVGVMLFALTGLHALKMYNSRKRTKTLTAVNPQPATQKGGKIIPLPHNVMHPAKEGVLIQKSVNEEETV
jgi:hypothetical protein